MGRIKLDPFPVRAKCPTCGVVTSNERLGGGRLRCKQCGTEWTYARAERPVQLSEAERRKPKPEGRVPVECAWCGRQFVPRRRWQVCCSEWCRDHASRDARAGLVLLMAETERLDAAMREVT